MSTCPDSDLYSAYVDGEVPSPWKEKLETHLEACPVCRKQVARYRAMRQLIVVGISPDRMPDLESSYTRLRARQMAAGSGKNKSNDKILEWVNFSIKIPVSALAAMLIAAIFLPALFVLKTAGSLRGQNDKFTAVQEEVRNLKTLVASKQVYSPDLPSGAIPVNPFAESGPGVFTMVDYARQFATDQDLFSSGNIIIIKLPRLTSFSDSDDLFHSSNEPILQAAGYYK